MKNLNERDHKIYTASQTMGGQVIFFLPTWKVVPGGYSDQRDTAGHTWNTPKKCFFSDRERPKEGERVARHHFHERVGESPRREKNFGTSGYKIRLFVSFLRYGRLKLKLLFDEFFM